MANIANHGDNILVLGTDDTDSIYNDRWNVTVDASAGNDTIQNSSEWSHHSIIDAGKGNDTIYNYGANVSIDAGAGNDSIENSGTSSFIIMGSGNDFITNGGGNVSIYAGSGNDTIILGDESKKNLIQYAAGDGSDMIRGFGEDDTLLIGDGTDTYSISKKGKSMVVTVGENIITLAGAASLSTLNITGARILTLTDADKSKPKIDSDVKIATRRLEATMSFKL